MPIYEYRCSSCSHELESLQKLSDAPLLHCPACGADALVKLMSAAGFQLKGSGWYATDFKGSGSKPAPAKDKDATKGEAKAETPKSADNDAGKSETKPAAPSESGSSSTAAAGAGETKAATPGGGSGAGVPSS